MRLVGGEATWPEYMPCICYVTGSGFGGDFTVLNGKHALSWLFLPHLSNNPWYWKLLAGKGIIGLLWSILGPHWYVNVLTKGYGIECGLRWRHYDPDPFSKNVGWNLYNCLDDECNDTGSCEASVGAILEVSRD
jgi:hypothetical protein